MDELEFKQVDSYVSTEGGIVDEWIVKTKFGDLYFPEPKYFENSNTYELTGLSLFKLVGFSKWSTSSNGRLKKIIKEKPDIFKKIYICNFLTRKNEKIKSIVISICWAIILSLYG